MTSRQLGVLALFVLSLMVLWVSAVPQAYAGATAIGGCTSCRGLDHPSCPYKGWTDGCESSYDVCTGESETRTCTSGGGSYACTNSDCASSYWNDLCD